MTKPEGINLDIQPHHVKRGAEHTKRNNQRERRLNAALLGKEVIIRQEHRSNGGVARKRAVAREKAEAGRVIPAEPRKRDSASLEPTSEAMADLLSAFGYPTAALAPKADRVYRDGEMDEPPPAKVRGPRPKRRPEDVRRMVAGGHWERACNACGRWQPETPNYYRWRQERKRWECECNTCHNQRRKAYYERNGV